METNIILHLPTLFYRNRFQVSGFSVMNHVNSIWFESILPRSELVYLSTLMYFLTYHVSLAIWAAYFIDNLVSQERKQSSMRNIKHRYLKQDNNSKG